MADEKIEEKIEEAQQTAADALEGVSDVATDLDDHTEEDEALWDELRSEILAPMVTEIENLKLELTSLRTDMHSIMKELQTELESLKPMDEPMPEEVKEEVKEEPKVEPEPEPALPIEPVETIVEEKPVEKPKQRIRFL